MKIFPLFPIFASLACMLVPQISLAQGTVPPGWHPQSSVGPLEIQPYLNSRPTATRVLYLDMDGATIPASATHDWNAGNLFVVAHSGLSAVQMREIYEHVKEDFLPFNINVTTEESKYTSAPAGQRMRCIITPTDAWYWITEGTDPMGGRAHGSSFRLAGISKAADVPCFAFITSFDGSGKTNENSRILAGAVSHEFGHTLGLEHDGFTGDAGGYYAGHGTGPTGGIIRLWSPIMGSHQSLLTQWCNGEYSTYASTQVSPNPAAINPKDDVAIIANTGLNGNGFGYAADDHGSTSGAASPLSTGGNSIFTNGVIGRGPSGEEDEDWFQFTIATPMTLNLVVKPAEPFTSGTAYNVMLQNLGLANLNPRVDLFRSNLTTLQSASGVNIISLPPNPTQQQQLQLTELLRVRMTQSLAAGTYYIKISGVGFGDPASTGYSSYGSLGAYSIDGTLLQPPVVTSGGSAGGTVATTFTPYQLTATGSVTSWSGTSLPSGLKVDPSNGLITGVPTAAGTFNATVTATGPGGSTNRAMTFIIAAGTALADATETTSFAWTIPAGYAGWFIQSGTTHDTVDAAQSAPIGDSSSAAMETQVSGPGTLSFWWRVNSENFDFVRFLVDGIEQPGGVWSGDRAWAQKTYTLGIGTHTLRWIYTKDSNTASGADAAWVDQIVWTGQTPTVTSATTLSVNAGQNVSYFITSSINPANFGATNLPPGLDINGSTGEITGRVATPGNYAVILTASTPGGIAIAQLNITANATAFVTATEAALDWVTSGNGGNVWFSQTSESQDGVDALRSGAITNGQTSYLQASVFGPGTLNFWWKTDSEFDSDFLEFRIDGILASTPISGPRGWSQRSVSVTGAGQHFVSWTYRKDAAGASGQDAGFVDGVVWTPVPQVPVINSAGSVTGTVGSQIFLQVTATNAPTSFAITSGTLPSGANFNVLGAGMLGGIPDRPGTFPIQVTATNAAGNSTPGTITVVIRSSFEMWASNFALAGGNGTTSADPDKDGRNNLLEMALNLRPDLNESTFAPISLDPATGRLRATFTRVAAYMDLQYDVQVTDNLGSWTTIARSTNGGLMTSLGAFSVTDPGGATPTVVVVDNASWPTKTKRSMRIKITQL